MRVLVVEDDPMVRRVYQLLFRGRCEVHTTGDGREAMAMMRQMSFSLIIADLHFQEGPGGLAVLEYAAAIQPRARRVMITGAASDAIPRTVHTSPGVEAVLVKPVATSVLLSLLEFSTPTES